MIAVPRFFDLFVYMLFASGKTLDKSISQPGSTVTFAVSFAVYISDKTSLSFLSGR